jgi:hypothetical protein
VELDPNIHWDFSKLLNAPPAELLVELAEAHSAIANLSLKASFLRAEETRDPKNPSIKALRIEHEGLRDAYIEKKYLIYHLSKNHAS